MEVTAGARFGKWTLLEPVPERSWLCRCVCGRESRVKASNLRRGASKQCLSCATTTHGGFRYKDPAYRVWMMMRNRCKPDPTTDWYACYAGRGIIVCDRWQSSFPAFLADMGPRPSMAHSIDRIDNDGNYEPGNCRWATQGEQSRNTSRNRMLTHAGRTMCLTDWSAETGIAYSTLRVRLDVCGWPVDRALTTPANPRGKRHS